MAISDTGKEVVASLIVGSSTDFFDYLAIGSDSVAANALGYEFTGSGAARGISDNTLITTTSTNDTGQFVKQWTFTAGLAITEWGLFNAVSTGDTLALANISAVNVGSEDTFQLTVKVQVS